MSVRAIKPDDAARLDAFHERLTQETVYKRYFNAHPHLGNDEIDRFTNVDYHRRMALVGLMADRIVGVARYDAPPGVGRAEVAFVVADELQGHGVGTLLLEHLSALARRRGIGAFEADTLATNDQMQDMFRQAGFDRRAEWTDGLVHVGFRIAPTQGYLDAVLDRHASSAAAWLDPRVERIGAGALRVVCCSGWSARSARAAAVEAGAGLSDVVVTPDPSLGLAAFLSEGSGPVVVDLDRLLRPRTLIAVARHAGAGIVALDRGNRFAQVCEQAGIRRTYDWTKAVVAASCHSFESVGRGAIMDLSDCDVTAARRLLDSRDEATATTPVCLDDRLTAQIVAAYGIGRLPDAKVTFANDGTGLAARSTAVATKAVTRHLPLTDRDAFELVGSDFDAILRLDRLVDDQAEICRVDVRPDGVRIWLGDRRGIQDDPFVRVLAIDAATEERT